MIQVESLTKSFGALRAVDAVSFRVPPGMIYGLLGPNGAGKTTTISCVCGLLRPDAGTVSIGGHDMAGDPLAAKAILGVVPQETAIYPTLTAAENVSYFADLYRLDSGAKPERVREVLTQVGLEPGSKQRSKTFSGGMKRRLNLAIGFVHRPRALLLDEPTVGIDPQARIHVLDVVRALRAEGTAILYTTHYLEEAEELCDRIAVMDHGRILAEGTIPELRRLLGEGTILTLRGRFTAEQVRPLLDGRDGMRVLSLEDGDAKISVSGEQDAGAALSAEVMRRGVPVSEISMREPSLQDLFLKLTGRELRD
ncbi:MAG: ATP-binding cassette domain-containing protein [Candidatus Eisenbacteria bacterium]|nr:ABC transporter ATP-binding protein [Candidatus Eisenbacteria bacterium]